ncbi:MAG: adenosylmethionine--8-amino-7-oxononanoate aminotransferase BioA [marine bacterium B5-7]|nr:MAG: adenosylmethionine--8-amino-7-oxononanoate aminotransferase BioA [marine bacterium B5-7]
MSGSTIEQYIPQTHWAPLSQLDGSNKWAPYRIQSAQGDYITLESGQRIIDASSSWWCKLLGHGHPALKQALFKQAEQFEHVVPADTTNDVIEQLSHELTQLMPHFTKVFYAGDGACAVEIAMKMSLQTRTTRKQSRTQVVSLKGAYHGETLGCLGVTQIPRFRHAFEHALSPQPVIQDIPYVNSMDDPLWKDASVYWERAEKQLTPIAHTLTAVIVEPILQAANHMKIYSQDFLRRLCLWAKAHDIHVIVDEIATGLGRTGKMLACEYAMTPHGHPALDAGSPSNTAAPSGDTGSEAGMTTWQPDFLCLGKGLTGGWIPMSAVLTTDNIHQHFINTPFYHSHTYAGNALAASVALATLNVLKQENLVERANVIGTWMRDAMQSIADQTGSLAHVRQIGAVVAADLIHEDPNFPIGQHVYRKAVELGALLRPLGNTLYWLPPLNVRMQTLEDLKAITQQAITWCA